MDGLTGEEMLAEAANIGRPISRKLLERWVTIGLLDQAAARGRSRGKGVERRWPVEQRNLLRDLLSRHRTGASVSGLLNVPVLVWLLWGEDYVPIRQVQRAMETWVRRTETRRSIRSRAWAAGIVRALALPRPAARARQILVDDITRWLDTGDVDRTAMVRLLIEVVGPEDRAAQTDGLRAFELIAAQVALARKFATLTPMHFGWARARYLASQAQYAADRVALTADPRFGKLHESFDLQYIANRACHDLALILGLAVQGIPPEVDTPDALRLDVWLQGRAHMQTETTLHRSALWLPPGTPNAGLGISIRIDIDPAGQGQV
jgi:hypothetical protein